MSRTRTSRFAFVAMCILLCIFTAIVPSLLCTNQSEVRSQSLSRSPLSRVVGIDTDGVPLPSGAIARLGSLRLRHELDVRSVAFSPDGRKIASVSEYDDTIRVWDVATGAPICRFRAPGICSSDFFARTDYALAFTPDGKAVAAGAGSDVCFWDIQTGKESKRFRGKCKAITALTFSDDKRTFFCGGSDNKLYQWGIATGKLVRSWDYFEGNQPRTFASGFKEKTAIVKAISPDGKTAAWQITKWDDNGTGVSAEKAFLVVWDVSTGKDRRRVTDTDGKDFFDADVVFSADGKYMTARGGNSYMNLRDSLTGARVKTIIGGGIADAVAYSPDGRYVAAQIRQHGLCLWNLATGKELWRDPVAPWYAVGHRNTIMFAPDGKRVALTSGRNVLLWDTESGQSIPPLDGHRWPIRTLHSTQEAALISADCASVCEWNSAFRQTKKNSRIAYHGHTLSFAESYHANLRIFQPEGRPPQLRELIADKLLHEFADLPGSYSHHGGLSADGRIAVLARADSNEIAILDIAARKLRMTVKFEEPQRGSLVLSADGKFLAALQQDQTIYLIDTDQGKIIRRLGTPRPTPGDKEPRRNLTIGEFSLDGKLLAFASVMERPGDYWKWKFGGGFSGDIEPDPPAIRAWHVSSGREMRQFANSLKDAAHGHIAMMRFTPDNKSLAVALTFNPSHFGNPEERFVPILEVASGQRRRKLQGHTDHVNAVAFSSDGRTLASGGYDTTILLWNITHRRQDKRTTGKSPGELLRLYWENLAALEADLAFDAVLALVEMPHLCVPFFAERVKPVETPSKEQLAGWINALNSNSFTTRIRATEKLINVSELAAPSLKVALDGNVSLESRRRIEGVIAQADPASHCPTLMRNLRAVEVLERIGTPAAHRHLEHLASGASDARLTVEARDSLSRLKRRP